MNPISIVALDDDPEYLIELERVFSGSDKFAWGGGFSNSVQFLGRLPELNADVFLLDVSVPKYSGIDCLKSIVEFRPECTSIMLTVCDDDERVLEAFLEGASGYLLKDAGPEKIRSAIDEVLGGGAPMTPSIARKVIQLLGRRRSDVSHPDAAATSAEEVSDSDSVKAILSPREYEVLQELAAGRKYAEIAARLFISLATVKTHLRKIYEKLRVRNKVEAISRLSNGGS